MTTTDEMNEMVSAEANAVETLPNGVSSYSNEYSSDSPDLKDRDVEECLQSNRNFNWNSRGKFEDRSTTSLREAATVAFAATLKRYATAS